MTSMRGSQIAAVLAVAAVGLACPKTGETGGIPKGVTKWAPPPEVVEYERINRAGPLPLPDVFIRDTWEGPTQKDGRLLYDVTSWEMGEIPVTVERATVFYGPEGYGYLGTWNENGTFSEWSPPQIVLPKRPRIGATWSATHTKGPDVSERSCEIMASNLCEGGIVSVCDSKREQGRIVLRDHFCPDVGWSGFEAMVIIAEMPPVRMWSQHVVRDGVTLPEPPEEPE